MTPKQQARLQNKIKKIKSALAADKKHWGGYYHDGGGLRYLPPGLYIQLEDYSGGLRYLNWFKKNFPDDAYPSDEPIRLVLDNITGSIISRALAYRPASCWATAGTGLSVCGFGSFQRHL